MFLSPQLEEPEFLEDLFSALDQVEHHPESDSSKNIIEVSTLSKSATPPGLIFYSPFLFSFFFFIYL